MKKRFLLCIAIVIASMASKAQSITIYQSDMPVIGDVFIRAADTINTGTSIGNTGANQIWNLINLQTHMLDSTLMVLPSTLPGFASFPNANIATNQLGFVQSFFKSSASSYDMLGFYADFLQTGDYSVVKYNPPLTNIKLPSTFGTTNNGNTSYEIVMPFPNPPVDSIKIHVDATYSTEVDAWGTITTPTFSNVACIRQKSYSISTNSVAMHVMGNWVPTGQSTTDTSITYSWYSNTAHSPIAEVITDPSGIITQSNYLVAKDYVGLNEVAGKSKTLQMFPNPASNVINISGVASKAEMLVFDMSGKLVDTKILTASQTSYSITDYKPGIYFYQISEFESNTIFRGKFVVVK